jgi:hypothetical protein
VDAAVEVADAARAVPFPPNEADIVAVLGIALVRQGHAEGAKRVFSEAFESAGRRLQATDDDYGALDTKALALCGLALVDDPRQADQAKASFAAARAITRAEGIVRRVLGLFDALAICDDAGVLQPVRPAAGGDGA